jgi:alpha-soluble NSF attachment protein
VYRSKLDDPLEAARMLQDAFKVYSEASPLDAVRVMEQSVGMYSAKGNFRRAADLEVQLADVYDSKLEDRAKALQCLETAITWFTDERTPATANRERHKAGQLAASMGDYYKAVQIFVDGAEACQRMGESAKWSIPQFLLKAGSKSGPHNFFSRDCWVANAKLLVCQLATGDLVGTKKVLYQWHQMGEFGGSMQEQALQKITAAVEEEDPDSIPDPDTYRLNKRMRHFTGVYEILANVRQSWSPQIWTNGCCKCFGW